MKKRLLNYLLMIIILLGLNCISYLLVFLFYGFSPELPELDYILEYSVFLFFVIVSIILSRFIHTKSLPILQSIIVLYIIIAIFRFVEVVILKSPSGFMWCSIGAIQFFLNIILQEGSRYIDWWTIIIFPIFQPLGVFILYKFRK